METAGIVTWVMFGIALWIAAGAAFLFGWMAFNKAIESTSASREPAVVRGAAESAAPAHQPLSSGTRPSPAPSKSVLA